MNIQSISFKNYKSFAEEQQLVIKPLTILIGKNSSGKSAIAKLFTLLQNSLSGKIDEPLLISNNGVTLGGDFRDLVYNRIPSLPIQFSIFFGDKRLTVEVIKIAETSPILKIYTWEFNGLKFQYDPKENVYIDGNDKKYNITFKGFLPTKIIQNDGSTMTIDLGDLTIDVDYIGPFRVLPQRAFTLTGQLDFENMGIKGENAYSILGTSRLLDSELHKKVGEWYETNFDGWKLGVEVKKEPFIEIVLSKNENTVNIVDVGQGMNQALPLVVRSNIARPYSLSIFEQPELHLHPAAHGDLAELFVKSAKEHSQSFLIETHAENILLRIRRLIVENKYGLKPDDVIIYWINEAATRGQQIEEITIDESGVLSDWPEGVFAENILEITELRKAIKNKKDEKNIKGE